LTSAQKTGSDGAPLVTAVLACTNFASAAPPSDFDPSTALARGIFEVRTGGDIVPAFAYNAARDETAPIDPYQGGATPLWGVEGTFNSGPTGVSRYLVYGFPLDTGSDVRNTGFELGTLPAGVNVNGLAVGVCASALGAGLTSANLLEHDATEVLLTHNASFCVGHMVANATRGNPLMQRLVQLITPKDAFAQEGRDEFIGGLPSGWSPFKVKNYQASNVPLSFTLQPQNTNVNTLVTVQVSTTGTVAPVVINLTIAGNNGDPTTLEVPDGNGGWTPKASLSAVTVGNVATFTYAYSKAGGYTLTAIGNLGGTDALTQSSISNLFQVKSK